MAVNGMVTLAAFMMVSSMVCLVFLILGGATATSRPG